MKVVRGRFCSLRARSAAARGFGGSSAELEIGPDRDDEHENARDRQERRRDEQPADEPATIAVGEENQQPQEHDNGAERGEVEDEHQEEPDHPVPGIGVMGNELFARVMEDPIVEGQEGEEGRGEQAQGDNAFPSGENLHAELRRRTCYYLDQPVTCKRCGFCNLSWFGPLWD